MRIKLSPKEVEWLSMFHYGQSDALYAVVSRLVAYGATDASVEEAERILETCWEVLYDGNNEHSPYDERMAVKIGQFVYSLDGVRGEVSEEFQCFKV